MTPEALQLRLGFAIRHHRERLKYSQEEFADMIGVHRTYYGGVERGRQNPTIWSLYKIAQGLGLRMSHLFTEAEDLDLERAVREPPNPPRRGRPPGRRSR